MPGRGQQDSKDKSVVVPITLITLSGDDINIEISLSERDKLHHFENVVLEQLPWIGTSSTFGCELQFVEPDSNATLADPIWDTLRVGRTFYVLAQPCFVGAVHKGQLKGEAKAIKVPSARADQIPPQAFSFHTEVRHVEVEPGIWMVGEAAWRSCQRLQIVSLPDTVVSLRNSAFRRCYALRAITIPGCKQFGFQVFEGCCSLTQVGRKEHPNNELAPQAQLRPRAFANCAALHHLDLGKETAGAYPTRSLPECCFVEAGIFELCLPTDFDWVGPAACYRCQQLQTVDLSQANISEILSSTFAQCSQLQRLNLSSNLRIIDEEAFFQCVSLQEVCMPASLLYIARRAFAGCTQLRSLYRQGKSTTWRGTYARLNAFDQCKLLGQPAWLRYLPSNAKDLCQESFRQAST